jgi:hypothetical protein
MVLLGRLLGWLIVASFFLTVLNYPVKWVFRRYLAKLPRESAVKRRYQVFLRIISGKHRYFAIVASVSLLAHFFIQFSLYGLRLTGIIAGLLLLLQATLGAYGTYIRKRKPTAWFYAHRTVAVLLIVAMVVHILKF